MEARFGAYQNKKHTKKIIIWPISHDNVTYRMPESESIRGEFPKSFVRFLSSSMTRFLLFGIGLEFVKGVTRPLKQEKN